MWWLCSYCISSHVGVGGAGGDRACDVGGVLYWYLEKCILSWTHVQMDIRSCSYSSTEHACLFCRLQWGRKKLCLKPSNQDLGDLVLCRATSFLYLLSLFSVCRQELKVQMVRCCRQKNPNPKIFQGDFLFHYYLLVYSLVFWRSEVYNLVCNPADLDYWFLFPLRLTDSSFQASDLEKLCAVLKECNSISELEWVLLNSYGLYLHSLGYWENASCFFCSVLWRKW